MLHRQGPGGGGVPSVVTRTFHQCGIWPAISASSVLARGRPPRHAGGRRRKDCFVGNLRVAGLTRPAVPADRGRGWAGNVDWPGRPALGRQPERTRSRWRAKAGQWTKRERLTGRLVPPRANRPLSWPGNTPIRVNPRGGPGSPGEQNRALPPRRPAGSNAGRPAHGARTTTIAACCPGVPRGLRPSTTLDVTFNPEADAPQPGPRRPSFKVPAIRHCRPGGATRPASCRPRATRDETGPRARRRPRPGDRRGHITAVDHTLFHRPAPGERNYGARYSEPARPGTAKPYVGRTSAALEAAQKGTVPRH